MNYKINLVFVFDGVPPDAKKRIINKRIRQKQKIEQRVSEMPQGKESEKLSKQLIYISKDEREESKMFLELLGIDVYQSKGEAESLCASLNKSGIVDYVYTEDTDSLAYGSPFMIKQYRGAYNLMEISLKNILTEMKITFDQFIDLCILCGCDYSNNIPRMNYDESYRLLQRYNDIPHILENITIVPEFFNYIEARTLFKTMESVPILEYVSLQEEKVKSFLLNCDLNASSIDYFINTFKRRSIL